jgi:hypothetical protein
VSIWQHKTQKGGCKRQKESPGPEWAIVRRKSITKCKVTCPTCKKDRMILESTRDAWNFSELCLSCSRIAKNKAKAEENFRPVKHRECAKCDRFFKPTVQRWFLCEKCFEDNQNPSQFQACAEGCEYS